MSSVPFRNTDFVNNPIGNDRPIYGNELVPDGGCLPEGYGPGIILDENNPGNKIFLWEMTDYSGGSLTSAFIDTNTSTDFRYHSSYYINTPLSGVNYPAYQGYMELFGTPATTILVYNVDGSGYTLAVWPYVPNEINPIYGGVATSTIITNIGTSFNPPTIINNRAYLPDTLYSNGGLPVSYTGTPCQQITPTPTPTSGLIPSATPTPSPTPAFCVEYVVENTFPFPSGAVYYGCCDTDQTNHTVLPGTTYTFCAREIVQLGALTVVSSGASATCNSEIPCPSPTPTPTPSITPSITPSPTNCNCLEYDVNNNTEFDVDTISWLDCNQQSQEQSLGPGSILRICACAGSVQSRGGHSTITLIGSCSITPTPTATPTHTPTPSTTPYAYRYEVSGCNDPTDVQTFWSDDFYPIGKVVKGYNDPTLCFEIVGSSTLPPDDEIAASYVSCQSCLA